jgi:hypothetical protein
MLSIIRFSIMTLRLMTLSIETFRIMALSIMTFSIMTSSILTFSLVEWVFIETGFHRMAFSSNAQFNLVFKTVSRISVAPLHPKLLVIW